MSASAVLVNEGLDFVFGKCLLIIVRAGWMLLVACIVPVVGLELLSSCSVLCWFVLLCLFYIGSDLLLLPFAIRLALRSPCLCLALHCLYSHGFLMFLLVCVCFLCFDLIRALSRFAVMCIAFRCIALFRLALLSALHCVHLASRLPCTVLYCFALLCFALRCFALLREPSQAAFPGERGPNISDPSTGLMVR